MKTLFRSLFTTILFLGLGAFGATGPESFLQEQKMIRIYVDSAPGFGHQSAGISVMTRLRELGFRGEFEVVYQPAVAEKIKKIYPGFPQGISREVHYLAIDDYKKLSEQGNIPPVSLAVSGADDGFGSKFAKISRAETYLRLQPLGWGQAALYGKNSKILYGLQNLPLTNPRSSGIEEFIKDVKGANDLTEVKKDFTLKFAELSSSHFSFPVYGVGVQAFAPQRMYSYAKAVKAAAQKLNSQKAVIVPVVSPFNEQEMDTVLKTFGKTPGFEAFTTTEKKHQNQIHILTPAEFNALEAPKPGNVYFVFIGSVPQNIFNFFYEQATLPVWVAGKNAMSFAASKGKVYLNTVDDYYLPGRQNLSEASNKLIDRAYTAFSVGYQENANQYRLNDLSKFIQESSTPGTELQKFYSGIGEKMSANDRVLEGLRNVVGSPSVIMCREAFAP